MVPRLEENRLYFLRISFTSQFKNYTIAFARIGTKISVKNIVLLPNRSRNNVFVPGKLESVVQYKNKID
jgi:hypothetical protein